MIGILKYRQWWTTEPGCFLRQRASPKHCKGMPLPLFRSTSSEAGVSDSMWCILSHAASYRNSPVPNANVIDASSWTMLYWVLFLIVSILLFLLRQHRIA